MITFDLLLQWPAILFYLTIIITSYFYLYRNLNYWRKRGIPGPQPIPLFGNIHSYFLRSIPEVELDWYRKYGNFFGIYNGQKPVISVAKPELIKQILLKDFHTFRNRRETTNNPYLSKILFLARDDDWKRIRAITSPTFTSGKLKKMLSLIRECCDDFIRNLDEYVNTKHTEIELKKFNGAYTLDVIARCAFATNTNSYKNKENEFNQNANNLFKGALWPVLLPYVLPRFLMKSVTFRRLVMSRSRSSYFFVKMVSHLIQQRKSTANSSEKYNDFLQLLIDAEKTDDNSETTDEQSANLSNVSAKKLNENEIIAQCFLFFLAGFETTASTLAFCSYELAINPSVQQKLYEEIKDAFKETRDNISYDTLLELPYLDAVLSETLRKYPPVLRLEREAMDDVVVGDTGFTVPKGMIAEIPIYAIHYDSEYFDNPNQFDPQRFMPENRSNIKPYTYLPFGTGPRNCIGMRFALIEAKLALVNVLLKFRFFKSDNTDIPLKFNTGRGLLAANKLIVGIERRIPN